MNSPILPDGSSFALGSFPLPKDHWLYAPRAEGWDSERDCSSDTPLPILTNAQRQAVITAARYAVRGATMCGRDMDFDPDALALNVAYALCGPAVGAVLPADAPPTDEPLQPATLEQARQLAAQAWCKPVASAVEMDVRLADAFAEILLQVARGAEERIAVLKKELAAAPAAEPARPAGWDNQWDQFRPPLGDVVKRLRARRGLGSLGLEFVNDINQLLTACESALAWQPSTAEPVPADRAGLVEDFKVFRHVTNEWADMAANGLQWLRNVAEGISDPKEALANLEENMRHCRAVNDSPDAEAARKRLASSAAQVPEASDLLVMAVESRLLPLSKVMDADLQDRLTDFARRLLAAAPAAGGEHG